MNVATTLMICGALLGVPNPDGAEKLSEYLTKDGKLTGTLEITDVQGGFAGFTGQRWIIEPSGEWQAGRVFNQKFDMIRKGGLSKEQVAGLAKTLARYDLANLESQKEDKPQANPHLVTIKFGKREVTLTLNAGEPLPKPDPKKKKLSKAERAGGIAEAVKGLVKEKKEKE